MAEYGTVKVLLPRSKKPLEFDAKTGYDKNQWAEIGKEAGPAARPATRSITKSTWKTTDRAPDQRRLQGWPQVVSERASGRGRRHGPHLQKRLQRARRHVYCILFHQPWSR